MVANRGCIVCGASPTVKSHIFPRALMLDLRGDGPYVHEFSHERNGTRFLQNGPWDRFILCQKHEQITAQADDYAVQFCRNVLRTIQQGPKDHTIENPQPHLLSRFVCQSVWRYAVSTKGRGIESLGPYEEDIRKVVFLDAPSNLPFLMGRNHLKSPDGNEATLAIAPFPSRLDGVRIWLFAVSGLHFYLKTDKRTFPANAEEFSAHASTSVRLFQLPTKMAHEVPILQDLLSKGMGKG